MAILSKADFLERLKTIVGEDTSDETLSLIEDFTDTYNDLEEKSNNNAYEELQDKYNDLSKKYKERFFSGDNSTKTEPTTTDIPTPEPEVPDRAETITYDDLFVND